MGSGMGLPKTDVGLPKLDMELPKPEFLMCIANLLELNVQRRFLGGKSTQVETQLNSVRKKWKKKIIRRKGPISGEHMNNVITEHN